MSTSKMYQPVYSAGYEYSVGDTHYIIEKIEEGMYYARASNFVGYLCCRCDVFDANHGQNGSVSMGIGLTPHPEAEDNDESAREI